MPVFSADTRTWRKVLAGLAVVLLQVERALLQPVPISIRPPTFQDLLTASVSSEGNSIAQGPTGLPDPLVEPVVKLQVDGLRGYEHQRHLLGFAGQKVFAGNVGNVLCRCPGAGARQREGGLHRSWLGEKQKWLQGKLGVYDNRTLVFQEITQSGRVLFNSVYRNA